MKLYGDILGQMFFELVAKPSMFTRRIPLRLRSFENRLLIQYNLSISWSRNFLKA